MYDAVNLIPVAFYALVALALLATSRVAGGLSCVLASSYCGIMVLSFTRGSMGSILLPQIFLYLLAPFVLFRRAKPTFQSAVVGRWTYFLFAVYFVAIIVAALRHDPTLAMSMQRESD